MVTSVTSPATASRRLNASPLQRISEVVLIGGTVGAAAAASGPLWVVRLGVAAAIAAALMACAFAWRELNAARHAHAQAIIKATREHGVALTEERTRNASVVDILRLRISDARKVIERQRLRIAGQRLQIAELKADQNYLKGEIAYRDEVINALRGAVREQEPELIAQSDDAEVHHMPRRVFVAQDFVWQELSAEDEINDEALEALIDPKIISMVLPNYEADRQPA
jgi:myosin heavy subunit